MRKILAVVLAVLATAACGDTTQPLAPSTDPTSGAPNAPVPAGLLGQVVSGGYVLFFRHAERDASAMSTGDLAIADNQGICASGSELTAQGVADSLAIGANVKRYGIKVDHTFCSPTCRTEQMATLAFGEHEARRELTWPGMWSAEEQTSLTPRLRELLATIPARGTNLVLVAHGNVLVADRIGMTIELNQADAAIFRPLGNGAFEFVGIVTKDEWIH